MKEIKAVSEKKGRHEDEERGMGGGQGGGGELGSLRLDLHQLQKENLDLLSAHNQEVRSRCSPARRPPDASLPAGVQAAG